MRFRYMLAGLALTISLLSTGCGTTGCSRCGHHGNGPTVAQAVPIAPAPTPCCGQAPTGQLVPVPAQQSYSIPVFPSSGVR